MSGDNERLALRPYPARSAFLGMIKLSASTSGLHGEPARARAVTYDRQSVRSRRAEQASQSATSRRSSDSRLVTPAWLSAAAIHRRIIVAHGFSQAAIRAVNGKTAARRRSLGIACNTRRR